MSQLTLEPESDQSDQNRSTTTPAVARHLGEFTSLGAGVEAVHELWVGPWLQPLCLLILLCYVVRLIALVPRMFQLE